VVASVSRNCFAPRPRVDSTILALSVRRPPVVPEETRDIFRQVVKAGFATRRKTLSNSLSQGLGLPKEEVAALLSQSGIDPGRRAESLSVQEFLRLANAASAAGYRSSQD